MLKMFISKNLLNRFPHGIEHTTTLSSTGVVHFPKWIYTTFTARGLIKNSVDFALNTLPPMAATASYSWLERHAKIS